MIYKTRSKNTKEFTVDLSFLLRVYVNNELNFANIPDHGYRDIIDSKNGKLIKLIR
jgi:hypothetical protein